MKLFSPAFVSGVGMDWGVIDSGASFSSNDPAYYLHAHKAILGKNKLIVEYAKNLDKLTPTGYTVHLNPLNLQDTCGSPLRMIAIKNVHSAAVTRSPAKLLLLLLAVAAAAVF
jgi:kynurenine formamidase